jgi:ribose 5-phosphate isomerase B
VPKKAFARRKKNRYNNCTANPVMLTESLTDISMIFSSIALAADHGGFELQQQLYDWLTDAGVSVQHLGPKFLDEDDDYPLYAMAVAESVQNKPFQAGILVCRTGAGMAIVANRYKGIRAVVCRTEEDASLAREHNDANVLVLEGDRVDFEQAQAIILSFVGTEFGGGRHERRLGMFE